MKKVAVILAGCGHLDGSEIREAVITLLELDKRGADIQIFAPNHSQHHVINHLTKEETKETRNCLVEAARIARGEIKDLSKLNTDNFDALIMPGGFGAAKNLADIAFKGGEGKVIELVQKIIRAFVDKQKPVGAICISPAVVAAALKGRIRPTLTLGEKNELLAAFESDERVVLVDEIVFDQKNLIVSTPAYMYNDRISNVARGIEKLVAKIMEIS